MFRASLFVILCILLGGGESHRKRLAGVDMYDICQTKTSCQRCLQLEQCGWCEKLPNGTCFALKLKPSTCDKSEEEKLILHTDYGRGLAGNAKCSCDDAMGQASDQSDCRASDEGELCSGRGSCSCGRCVCDAMELPKVVSGQFCECDNFSCEGYYCDEGPYCMVSAKAPTAADENNDEDDK